MTPKPTPTNPKPQRCPDCDAEIARVHTPTCPRRIAQKREQERAKRLFFGREGVS